MKTIMVQMSDEQWTMEAMHLACALACNVGGKVVLLRLVLANNPGLLGWGITPPDPQEKHQIDEYATVAEDYGVEFTVQPMQYISIIEALTQVCGQLDVTTLFAHIPNSSIPLWKRFRLWSLKRQLGGCQLYTLDEKLPLSVEEPTAATTKQMKTAAH